MVEIKGNLHIHSTYSDGTKSIPEIAAMADEAQLDFIMINDHSHLEGLKRGEERYCGRVLVLIGTEINDRHNHYLACFIDHPVPNNDDNPQEVIDNVKKQGGIGFIAHPFEKGTPLSESGKAYNWTNWDVKGYDGICIWNYTSHWKDQAQSILKGLYYYYNRKAAFAQGPAPQNFALWDKECQSRKVVAIAGSDAHDYFFRWYIISGTIFPYSFLFKALNVHLLIERPLTRILETDKNMICQALKEGHGFISHDLLAPGEGFEFSARINDQDFPMGSELFFAENLYFSIKTPETSFMRLVKDGKPLADFKGKKWEYKVKEAGVYRVEAYLPGIFRKKWAWIFSNPIFLRC